MTAGLILLFVAGAIIGLLLWRTEGPNRYLNGKRSQSSRSRRRTNRLSGQPAQPVRKTTRQYLLSLLRGDRRTAERLLNQARWKYPGKSETWYWEKVIFDLERDRH